MAPSKHPYRRPCAATSRKLAPNPVTSRKTSSNSRPMKAIFKGLIFSAAGTFQGIRGDISHEQLAKYIKFHGGDFESKVTDETTHLICSIEEFKKKSEQVKKAWALSKARCQIVTFEWVEDCLIGGKTKRLLSTRGYTLDRTLVNLKKGNVDKKALRERFSESTRIAKELSNSNQYHFYYDTDGFEYKIVLSRIRLDGKTMIEKYTLYLFQSNAKSPPLYMFGAKFSRSNRPLTFYTQDCRPMDFFNAFTCFKKFFKIRTGVDWDDRLERIIPRKIENGKEVEHSFFKYIPPLAGRPVGLLPYGYVRPEDREVEEEQGYDTDSEVGDDKAEGEDEGEDKDDAGSDTSDCASGPASGSGSGHRSGLSEESAVSDVISVSSDGHDRAHSFEQDRDSMSNAETGTPGFERDTPSSDTSSIITVSADAESRFAGMGGQSGDAIEISSSESDEADG